MKNKNLRTILIIVLVFAVWAGLALYRTISRNPSWFDETTQEVSSEEVEERKEIEITDKGEFTYALAWCKYGNRWACVNIAGEAEIILDEQYTEVTDFCNSGYAMIKDKDGMKYVIDRSACLRLAEKSYICDTIITDSFQANLVVATKEVEEDGEKKIGYGLIDESLRWFKAPSSKNEYLKEFTKGIDGKVLTTEKGDKLYLATLDVTVEGVDEFLFYNNEIAMYRKGTDIYLIDKSGEHNRKSMENIAKCGEWTEGTIFCELTDGRKVFNDINGKIILDVTHLNIVNSPRFIEGYAGILMQTEEGLKYTVIDDKGNFQFEPRSGQMCDTLTSKVYRVSHAGADETQPLVTEVINEKGEVIFGVDSSITYFTNGYAIKDNKTYVKTDGTELVVTAKVKDL